MQCNSIMYKAVINNDNLPKYGELKLKTVGTGNSVAINIKSAVAQTLTIISGNGTFVASGAKTLPIAKNTEISPITTNDADVISVENKYELLQLNGKTDNGQNLSVADLSELEYCTKLKKLTLKHADSGNIQSLSKLTELTNLILVSANFTGDISNLSGMISLAELDVRNSAISGTIESLCEGMFAGGRVSGQLVISSIMNGITFNNQTRNGVKITFNSTGCAVVNTFASDAPLGTLSNGVWTYN